MKNKTMSLGRGRINNIYRVRSPGDKNLVVPLTDRSVCRSQMGDAGVVLFGITYEALVKYPRGSLEQVGLEFRKRIRCIADF